MLICAYSIYSDDPCSIQPQSIYYTLLERLSYSQNGSNQQGTAIWRCTSTGFIGSSVPMCQLGNKEWTNRANRIIWLFSFSLTLVRVCVCMSSKFHPFRNAYTLLCRWWYPSERFQYDWISHSNHFERFGSICNGNIYRILYNFYRVEWVFPKKIRIDVPCMNIEMVV